MSIDIADRYYDESDICVGVVLEIGQAVLDWVNLTMTLGHASPGNSIEYTPATSSGMGALIVRDFVAWATDHGELAPAAEERLRALVRGSGWAQASASKVDRGLVATTADPSP